MGAVVAGLEAAGEGGEKGFDESAPSFVWCGMASACWHIAVESIFFSGRSNTPRVMIEKSERTSFAGSVLFPATNRAICESIDIKTEWCGAGERS